MKPYGEAVPLSGASTDDVSAPVGIDDQSFERLYADLRKVCVRMSRRKWGIPPADMNTIVQDVFISYLANPNRVTGDLRTYLLSAIYFQCSNYWRSKRSEGRVFSDDDVQDLDRGGKATYDDFSGALCLGLDLLRTLEKLPPHCREALKLCCRDEETDAMAKALHTSPANVYRVVSRCRKRARDIYHSLTQVP